MNIDMDMLTPILIALIGASVVSGSLLSLRAKQAHEALMRDRSERSEFNDTLKQQVDRLAAQVAQLSTEKEALLKSIGDLKADLAAAQVTIKSLRTGSDYEEVRCERSTRLLFIALVLDQTGCRARAQSKRLLRSGAGM